MGRTREIEWAPLPELDAPDPYSEEDYQAELRRYESWDLLFPEPLPEPTEVEAAAAAYTLRRSCSVDSSSSSSSSSSSFKRRFPDEKTAAVFKKLREVLERPSRAASIPLG